MLRAFYNSNFEISNFHSSKIKQFSEFLTAPCVMHLFSTNDQADKLNDLELLKLQQGTKNRKIARISAENSVGARKFSPQFARRLANELFLCVDAKVMLFHKFKTRF